MKYSIIKHLLVAISLVQGIARQATATPINDVSLVPRKDYEPGDELKRTMCFCTSDNSLAQTDNDPTAFYNTSEGHVMGFTYDFEYYNHRMNKRMIVQSRKDGNICPTEDSDQDPYYHNKCLNWKDQNEDFCANFPLSLDYNLGIANKSYTFCYLFRGDELDGDKRDFFKFNGAKRGLPRKRDYIAPAGEVRNTCAKLCEKRLGLVSFNSRYGGWFDRIDGFHHFDDICTNDMDCDWERCPNCKMAPPETVYAEGTLSPPSNGDDDEEE
ncbi:MAG: hypothetical protein L6R41_006585 [Letrouitia leprolyta]|nr:MAG: hypothetical protein L6R41_006585 [Letrouitia leprolyta]